MVQRARRRVSLITTIASFIVVLSVLLSYNWTGGGFQPDAPTTILFGILVAAIIFVAARQASKTTRFCPACRRAIPADALLCPYCGQRLS